MSPPLLNPEIDAARLLRELTASEFVVVCAASLHTDASGVFRLPARILGEMTGIDANSSLPRLTRTLVEKGVFRLVDERSKPRAYRLNLPRSDHRYHQDDGISPFGTSHQNEGMSHQNPVTGHDPPQGPRIHVMYNWAGFTPSPGPPEVRGAKGQNPGNKF